MFNLCFPFIPSLFYIVLNDDYMLCKVTLGVLKGASKLNVLLLLLLFILETQIPTISEKPVKAWRISWTTASGIQRLLEVVSAILR